MFSSNWEYNEFDSRRRILNVDIEGYPVPETPTPPVKEAWKNKWKKDETIQVTCSGMKHEYAIKSYLVHSSLFKLTKILNDFFGNFSFY